MEKFVVTLTRPAKGKGGDMYTVQLKGERDVWKVYIPQSISREGVNNMAAPRIEVTLDPKR